MSVKVKEGIWGSDVFKDLQPVISTRSFRATALSVGRIATRLSSSKRCYRIPLIAMETRGTRGGRRWEFDGP
jgi:hypothetical protein